MLYLYKLLKWGNKQVKIKMDICVRLFTKQLIEQSIEDEEKKRLMFYIFVITEMDYLLKKQTNKL